MGYVAATRFLVIAGGGVSFGLSRSAAIDVGYRFGYVDTEESPLKISMAYGAFVFRF